MLHLKALGAEVVMTRSDVGKGHPQYYQDLAERIASETPGAFYVNQFNNPANPLAHETTTGPEIWEQMEHRRRRHRLRRRLGRHDHRAEPLTSRALRRRLEIVLADPVGSVLAEYIAHAARSARPARGWSKASAKTSFRRSPTCRAVQRGLLDPRRESFGTARELLRAEGILAGSSTGTLLAAALRYCREQTRPERVVTFVCDTGTSTCPRCSTTMDGRPGLARASIASATCAT